MCGIAGHVSFTRPLNQHEDTFVYEMCQDLLHRGPDAGRLQCLQHAILGHRRLAVIDLSPLGEQPMTDESNSVWVTFNGEIYNYRELRQQLIQRGRVFRSQSDTEVLIHGYLEWGCEELLVRLRGMFAFGLWDERAQILWLARDRLGVKPLYFCSKDDTVIAFCSEIAPLYRFCPLQPRTINRLSLDFYLAFGYVPPDQTISLQIDKVPPATAISFSRNGKRIVPFWQLPEPDQAISYDTAKPLILNALVQAVRVRLESDVPLGCFLSGGIDSGLITALAATNSSRTLTTLTAAFDTSSNDQEQRLANKVAAKYGTSHEQLSITSSILESLPSLLGFSGEPFADDSLLPSAAIAKAAKAKVTVALTGDGGDDLFAGYSRVVATHVADRLRGFVPDIFLAYGGRALENKSVPRRLRKLRTLLSSANLSLPTLYGEAGATFDSLHRSLIYRKSWEATDFILEHNELVKDIARQYSHLSKAEGFLRMDLRWRLPGRYLTKIDIASNAWALECRSPFLDQELVGLALTIPITAKLHRYRQKALLRDIALELLPSEVANAPKLGFASDIGKWLSGPFGHDLVHSLTPFHICQPDGPLNSDVVTEITRNHMEYSGIQGAQLWTLICLEIWWRTFVERRSLR